MRKKQAPCDLDDMQSLRVAKSLLDLLCLLGHADVFDQAPELGAREVGFVNRGAGSAVANFEGESVGVFAGFDLPFAELVALQTLGSIIAVSRVHIRAERWNNSRGNVQGEERELEIPRGVRRGAGFKSHHHTCGQMESVIGNQRGRKRRAVGD